MSEGVQKWVMRLYPPLLFQRIWVIKFDKGFRGVEVKVKKSFLNKNYNGSIFGGTIFSAADPFYPVLFSQILIHKGYKVRAWTHSSAVRFRRPSKTDLHFNIKISEEDIKQCEQVLNDAGKYRKTALIEIYDDNGQLCVSVLIKFYIRDLNFNGGL